MTLDTELIRSREYPWTATSPRIFLNSASTGAMPQRSIDVVHEMLARRACPALIPDTEIVATLARSRTLIAELISCAPEEVALVPNTSFGINIAANCLPLKSGDVVLTFEREFPANVYPWLALERRGIELRFIRCVNGLPDEQKLLEQLDDPKVRAVAVSWVSFASGYRVDLDRLGRECRDRGIFLSVDAIQGVGPLELDMNTLQVDILACGAQKWLLSPWGTGFCYVRKELVSELLPMDIGWLSLKGSDDFTRLTDYNLEFRDNARRFEVGTLPVQDFAAMNESISMLLSLGTAAVREHVRELTNFVTDWADARPNVTLLSPRDEAQRAGIVCLGFKDGDKVAAALRGAHVAFSLREGAIRLAPYIYNTRDELVKVIEILERAAR